MVTYQIYVVWCKLKNTASGSLCRFFRLRKEKKLFGLRQQPSTATQALQQAQAAAPSGLHVSNHSHGGPPNRIVSRPRCVKSYARVNMKERKCVARVRYRAFECLWPWREWNRFILPSCKDKDASYTFTQVNILRSSVIMLMACQEVHVLTIAFNCSNKHGAVVRPLQRHWQRPGDLRRHRKLGEKRYSSKSSSFPIQVQMLQKCCVLKCSLSCHVLEWCDDTESWSDGSQGLNGVGDKTKAEMFWMEIKHVTHLKHPRVQFYIASSSVRRI